MPKRQIKNPDALVTNGIAKQNGAVTNKSIPRPILGPTVSTNVPIKTRAMMVPVSMHQPGVVEIRLGHVQILTDDRDHRRSRESGDKGDEKSKPRHVEGHVVRSLERKDVQRHRLVFPVLFFIKRKEGKKEMVSTRPKNPSQKTRVYAYARASAAHRSDVQLSVPSRWNDEKNVFARF